MKLPVIGAGMMGIGGYYTADTMRDQLYQEAVEAAIDAGMTLLDTAEVYGDGNSERMIGTVVKRQYPRGGALLATKFSAANAGYRDVIKACEGSLKRLQMDRIDIYQMHWPNPNIPMQETAAALDKLVEEGKIGHIGVCNFSVSELEQFMEHLKHKLEFLQIEYSLFNRYGEAALIPFAKEHDIQILGYSPLSTGDLSLSPEKTEVLERIAKSNQVSVEQIVLSWIVSRGIIPIPKALKREHIRDNALAGELALDSNACKTIDETFAYAPQMIAPAEIDLPEGKNRPSIYLTREEAIENRFSSCPSPCKLAERLLEMPDELIPFKVKRTAPGSAKPYRLLGGQIRYWAFVIAFGENAGMPCLVKY